MDTLTGETQSKMSLSPVEKGSTLNGRNLLPLRATSVRFEYSQEGFGL